MFQGSLVALATPMLMDGSIDWESLDTLIDFHLGEGTEGLVVIGSTGEFATLNSKEQSKLIAHVVDRVNNRIPVIAGTGTNATASTIELTEHAMTLGVDACLIVTPYYNRPTQEGLYQHYKAVAESVPLPIIVYNVPKRTGCDLLPETLARLTAFSTIVGIKDATGDLVRYSEVIQVCLDKKVDLYGGDDPTCFDLMRMGGQGVISITGNIAPRQMREFCDAVQKQDYVPAEEMDNNLQTFHKIEGCESNPIPVKWALYKMGLIHTPMVRLPLTPLSSEFHPLVIKALMKMNLFVQEGID